MFQSQCVKGINADYNSLLHSHKTTCGTKSSICGFHPQKCSFIAHIFNIHSKMLHSRLFTRSFQRYCHSFYCFSIILFGDSMWYNIVSYMPSTSDFYHSHGEALLFDSQSWLVRTSSNKNIFCVTGPFLEESTGHRWIPITKASDAELWCFFDLHRKNGWANNRDAGDLRRHRAHHDVTVMPWMDSQRAQWWRHHTAACPSKHADDLVVLCLHEESLVNSYGLFTYITQGDITGNEAPLPLLSLIQ